jgi:SET domain-containing protein
VSEPLGLPRHDALRITEIEGKGRGVVAVEPILSGVLLEVSPVIRLTKKDSPPRDSVLYDYPSLWDDPPYGEAIVLGLASILNHSVSPNAKIEADLANQVLRLIAGRDIAAGEEITLDYGIPVWFETH